MGAASHSTVSPSRQLQEQSQRIPERALVHLGIDKMDHHMDRGTLDRLHPELPPSDLLFTQPPHLSIPFSATVLYMFGNRGTRNQLGRPEPTSGIVHGQSQ